jgi:hypothetical protein
MSGFPISAGTDPGQAARLLSTLSAGRALQAIVVGATRHGLVVRLDQQDLVLEKSPAFAAGTSLILKPEGKASEAGRQVQILAVNGQPLARPVTSALQPRPLSSTATPSDPGAALGDDTVTLSSSADRAARAEPPPASHAASGATRTMPPTGPARTCRAASTAAHHPVRRRPVPQDQHRTTPARPAWLRPRRPHRDRRRPPTRHRLTAPPAWRPTAPF